MADLKKQLFWITSVVVVLTIGILWFLAIGSLNDERTRNESNINSRFSALKKVDGVNDGNHPNTDFHNGMDSMLATVRADIRKTWDNKFNKQQLVFNWPIGPGQLDQITANYFIPLSPIESKVEMSGVINPNNKSVTTEISQIARIKYKDFITNYLPTLAETVDASWGPPPIDTDGFGGGSGPTAGFGDGVGAGVGDTESASSAEEEVMETRLVVWKDSNQKALEARFGWADRVPSTLEILYAQEDLWVLSQWLRIIAEMNQSADTPYNAKVTEIVGIDLAKNGSFIGPTGVELAKSALLDGGKISGGQGGDMMDGGMGMGMGMDMGAGGMMPGGENDDNDGGGDSGGGGGTAGTSAGTQTVASLDPGDLRYVDASYQPLPVADLRTALNITAQSTNVRTELAIAKRYPTRIRLKLDLRYLTQFLAACGNADLSIEVLQVRINAPSGMNKSGSAGGDMGGMGGMDGGMGMGGSDDDGEMTGGMGSMGGMGDMTGGMGMGGGFGNQNTELATSMPYHVEVEIYGIVQIYNPVNLEALGIEPEVNNSNAAPGGIGAE